jgi:hypothetical protein
MIARANDGFAPNAASLPHNDAHNLPDNSKRSAAGGRAGSCAGLGCHSFFDDKKGHPLRRPPEV